MQPAGEAGVEEASEVERREGRSRTGRSWPRDEVLLVQAPIGTMRWIASVVLATMARKDGPR